MPNLSSRCLHRELLDTGEVPDRETFRSLSDMRRINRIFGGRRLLLEGVASAVARSGLRRFSVLDIASGSCDLPLAILDWAERHGFDARVFALEYRHRHLTLFHSELSLHPRLLLICGDALHPPLPDRSFDFITCCNFLHHLAESEAQQLLALMKRLARQAFIISDLERHWFPYSFFRLTSRWFTDTAVSRVDGATSIGQAFQKAEMEQTARGAGIREFVVNRRWPFRLLMVARAA